jgi:hypothetical protein
VVAIRASRFAAGVHPLRQSSFRLVEGFGSPDVLTTCPARLTCGCAAFPAKLKFKLGQVGKHAGWELANAERMPPEALEIALRRTADRFDLWRYQLRRVWPD